MSYLLAVDPGIRGCGVAVFYEGVLEHAAYVENPYKRDSDAAAAGAMAHEIVEWAHLDGQPHVHIAVEWPRVYASRIRSGASKGDPNDLLALCGVDAAIVALMDRSSTSYAPSEWKGQMKKEACHARIKTRLSPLEAEVVAKAEKAARSMSHNMLDAVGVGLFHLGRFDKKRVIPV